MRKISADIIYPASAPPVEEGVVVVNESGEILDLLPDDKGLEEVERYNGIVCPGFINTHCHLELSHLKGRLHQKTGLINFLKPIIDIRKEEEEVIIDAMRLAEEEMITNGIVAVGDVCNEPISFSLKAQRKLIYHNFIEVISIEPSRADEVFEKGVKLYDTAVNHGLSCSVSPHAPYTASAELLKRVSDFSAEKEFPLTIHNQESAEENNFFLDGTGAIADFYSNFDIDFSFYHPPGVHSINWICEQMDSPQNLLMVHNTYTSENDIKSVLTFRDNIYWCFCPKANLYIEDKTPDIPFFEQMNDRITIGTDSLASNTQLSVLEELKTISKHFPELSTEKLIKWGTKNGAEYLGLDEEIGSLEKGKKPGLLLIDGLDKDGRLTGNSAVRRLV